MKSIILYHNFYQDITALKEIISNMEFLDSQYGQEIPDFNMISSDNAEFFAYIFGLDQNYKFEIPENSGVFRKPNTEIHNELGNFTAIIALEKTIISLYHKEDEESKIILYPNDVIMINSSIPHSIKSNLIQVFNLIIKPKIEE